jgi:GH24 family phage-related lysozyme (muramidase)
MPRVVPYERSVALRPELRASMTTQASPNAFGAQIGEAMQNVGRGMSAVGDILETVQDREDEAAAKEADVRYAETLRNLMYDPEAGYAYTQGKTALDQRQAVLDAAAKAREQAAAGLSPRARRYYDQAAQQRQDTFTETSIRHAGSERKTYIEQASAARLASFGNDAAVGFADPKVVERSIAAGKAELQSQAEDQGWDPDTYKLKSAEYESGILKNVALQMAAEDPIAAAAFVETNRKRMTGEHAFQMDNALRPAVKSEQAKRAANDILGEIIGGGGSGVEPVNVVEGVGVGQAKNLLRSKEGFRATPYWDTNAYRVGFGSDTITRADGSVVRVTQGMTVSRADAERDLTRRIGEFQNGIVRMVGRDKWDALPSNAQAALTSVAYNYGSLPFTVASAVVSGDRGAIATAIEGLAGHNGGVNRKRRLHEANLVRGGEGVPIVPSAGGGGGGGLGGMLAAGAVDYMAIEQRLQAIEDPDVREEARKRVNALLDAQEKASKQETKATQDALWERIYAGETPDAFSVEDKLAAGNEQVSAMWSAIEAKQARGEITTNEELFYTLKKQATDPEAFAGVNLNEYRDEISAKDIRTLIDLQTSAINDTQKAKAEGVVTKAVMDYAETQLNAIGITMVGKDGNDRAEAAKRIARFNESLSMMTQEFKQQHGRLPGYEEQTTMVKQLLLPMVVQKPWAMDESGFAFESRFLPDGATAEIRVDYADIPRDIREGIRKKLQLDLGRTPTEEDVTGEYTRFLLSR